MEIADENGCICLSLPLEQEFAVGRGHKGLPRSLATDRTVSRLQMFLRAQEQPVESEGSSRGPRQQHLQKQFLTSSTKLAPSALVHLEALGKNPICVQRTREGTLGALTRDENSEWPLQFVEKGGEVWLEAGDAFSLSIRKPHFLTITAVSHKTNQTPPRTASLPVSQEGRQRPSDLLSPVGFAWPSVTSSAAATNPRDAHPKGRKSSPGSFSPVSVVEGGLTTNSGDAGMAYSAVAPTCGGKVEDPPTVSHIYKAPEGPDRIRGDQRKRGPVWVSGPEDPQTYPDTDVGMDSHNAGMAAAVARRMRIREEMRAKEASCSQAAETTWRSQVSVQAVEVSHGRLGPCGSGSEELGDLQVTEGASGDSQPADGVQAEKEARANGVQAKREATANEPVVTRGGVGGRIRRSKIDAELVEGAEIRVRAPSTTTKQARKEAMANEALESHEVKETEKAEASGGRRNRLLQSDVESVKEAETRARVRTAAMPLSESEEAKWRNEGFDPEEEFGIIWEGFEFAEPTRGRKTAEKSAEWSWHIVKRNRSGDEDEDSTSSGQDANLEEAKSSSSGGGEMEDGEGPQETEEEEEEDLEDFEENEVRRLTKEARAWQAREGGPGSGRSFSDADMKARGARRRDVGMRDDDVGQRAGEGGEKEQQRGSSRSTAGRGSEGSERKRHEQVTEGLHRKAEGGRRKKPRIPWEDGEDEEEDDEYKDEKEEEDEGEGVEEPEEEEEEEGSEEIEAGRDADRKEEEGAKVKVDKRPFCKYGAKCFRKNVAHLADFRHSGRP
eukprot:TRINITY_DN5589_c1_g4_i1.p1 TRINITY_DN5589_c1_g4~~TRINITY_DN5589_c1_g4_i1.p1  ORF type:complete len:783 (-),score=164.62 TRINITY_DN5589_c1_g4_i1:292-2640(-)